MSAATPTRRAWAFFDVDNTITPRTVGVDYIKHLLRRGLLSPKYSVMAPLIGIAYKRGILSAEGLIRFGARSVQGIPRERLEHEAEEVWRKMIQPTIYPEVAPTIARHRERGEGTLIVSGSPQMVLEPIAAGVGFDHAVGARSRFVDGRADGEMDGMATRAHGKVFEIERLLGAESIDWANSWVYSDQASDLPLLEKAGNPVAVNPGPGLEKIAAERGWEVQTWGGGR